MTHSLNLSKRLTSSPLKRLTFVTSVFSALCSLGALNALSAASFDCAKATSASAKLICSDPTLSALDERLGATYKTLRAQLSKEAQAELKSSQRLWLKSWPRRCSSDNKKVALTAQQLPCAKERYEQRIKELTLQPFEGRKIYTPTLYGVSLSEVDWSDEPQRTHQSLSFPQLTDQGLNAKERELVKKLNAWLKPSETELAWLKKGGDFELNATLSKVVVPQVDSALWCLAANSIWMGGAHEMSAFERRCFHLKARRPFVTSDLFVKPGWESALAELTFKALKAHIPDELSVSSAQELMSLVSNVKTWGLTPTGLTLDFNPDDVAPSSSGPQSVTIPWEQLSVYLK